MNRKQRLAAMRFAGYHNDNTSFTRLLIEGSRRVSYVAAQAAWMEGSRASEAGIGCTCHECKEGKDAQPLGYMQGRGAS